MGREEPVTQGSNATQIETKDGWWSVEGRYLDVTVVLATALVKAGYEVVLATPTLDPATDAVARFGADEAKGWQ